MDLREGINILCGDNGSGKTLVGKTVAGEIPISRYIPKQILSWAVFAEAKSGILFNDTYSDQIGSFRRLWKRGHSYFLDSDPGRILVRQFVEGELSLASEGVRENAKKIISKYGVSDSNLVDDLSHGLRRLLSFLLIEDGLFFVVLDEPFANLSRCLQKVVAGEIFRRLASKQWRSVIITSNRPWSTIYSLASGRDLQVQ